MGSSVTFGKAIGVTLFSLVFLAIGILILVVTEPATARQASAIDEIDRVAIADVSVGQVLAENEGEVVHVVGRIDTDQMVTNDELGISENAVLISWDSSIYQEFEETTGTGDDERTVTVTRWIDQVAETPRNEGSRKTLPADGMSFADNVAFGAFTLPEDLLLQLDREPLPITALPPSRASVGTLSDGILWTGNPDDPRIGDERLEFFIVRPPIDVTVIAQQNSSTLTDYQTESGAEIALLYEGTFSKDEIVAIERVVNQFVAWMVRFGSFVFFVFAFEVFALQFKPKFVFFRLIGKGTVFGAVLLLVVAIMALLIGLLRASIQPSAIWFVLAAVAGGTSIMWLVRKNREAAAERTAEREAEIAAWQPQDEVRVGSQPQDAVRQ